MWDAMGAICVSKPSRPFNIMFYWPHTGTHTCFLTSLSLGLLTHPTGMVCSGVCEAMAFCRGPALSPGRPCYYKVKKDVGGKATKALGSSITHGEKAMHVNNAAHK